MDDKLLEIIRKTLPEYYVGYWGESDRINVYAAKRDRKPAFSVQTERKKGRYRLNFNYPDSFDGQKALDIENRLFGALEEAYKRTGSLELNLWDTWKVKLDWTIKRKIR